jgi:uncharacterized phiE125 gp8 family phage protein
MADPITLEQAKAQLRVTGTSEDALIQDQIAAAAAWVEDYTGLVLTQRSVTERVSALCGGARLLAWPVAADQPVSISYRDHLGGSYEIAGAVIRAATRPAVVYPAAGTRWSWAGSAEVTFTAGFAAASDIPKGRDRRCW